MIIFRIKEIIIIVSLLLYFTGCHGDDNSKPTNQNSSTYKYYSMNQAGAVLSEVVPPPLITNHDLVYTKIDNSSISASLATVLKYTYNEDVNEQSVIDRLLLYGDMESIATKRAFSLLDVRKYLEAIGYTGTGYNLDAPISFEQFQKDKLETMANTTIIPVVINGYRHFVVFRGFDNKYIYCGDPYNGNISLSFKNFSECIVNNIIFVIGQKKP